MALASEMAAMVLSKTTKLSVGAAGAVMANLRKLGLTDPIRRYIGEGRPFLGICIGLQVLLSGTEEGGWHECLGIIPGTVRKLLALSH